MVYTTHSIPYTQLFSVFFPFKFCTFFHSKIISSENVKVTRFTTIKLNSKIQTHFNNVMDNLQEELRSNLNIATEIPCLTSYLMALVMLALSVTISKLFAIEIVHDLDYDLYGLRSHINNPIESPYMTCCLMVIVIFIISKIFSDEMCVTLILTFRIGQRQM